MPMKVGTVDQNFYNARNILSDELTLATGDDMRGLFANPNQLATQTAYKQRTLNKLISSITESNETDAVIDETELIIDTMKQMYEESKEKPVVSVRGYKVKQASRGSRIPSFSKSPNTEDSFELMPSAFNSKIRIKIGGKSEADRENENAVKNTMLFLQTIMPLAQALPEFSTKFDMYGLVYDIAERLGVDMSQAFPQIQENSISDAEEAVQSILRNRPPDVRPKNPQETVTELAEIRGTQVFRDMTLAQKNMFDSFMQSLLMMRPERPEDTQQPQLQNNVMVTGVSMPKASQIDMQGNDAESVASSQTFKTIGQ